MKPPYLGGGGDGGFSLEPCSSKSPFQDYHHPDHQFPANASSKTLQFGVHTACLDPFENFSYGSSMNLDVYELKPSPKTSEWPRIFRPIMVAEEEEGDICCSIIIREQQLWPPSPQRCRANGVQLSRNQAGKLCYTG